MAYHLEGTELVIDGWQNGVSDNPYQGLCDMRGINIISVPGETALAYRPAVGSLASVTASVVSADPSTNIVTVTITTGSLQSYQAVTFAGGSLPTGIVAGTVYWLERLSITTAKVYTDRNLVTPLNITATGTGTMASVDIATIKYFDTMTGAALDSNGRVWSNQASNNYYSFMGNSVSGTTGLSSTNGNGLCWFNGYLFVFYDSSICYLPWTIGTIVTGAWVNEWNPATAAPDPGVQIFNTGYGIHNPHAAIVAVNDGGLYITDSNYVASLLVNSGSTFNPASGSTYTWAKKAVTMPTGDVMNCLTELGDQLLIGGSQNAIYTWNRLDTNRGLAILISDVGIYRLITVNTNAYAFAGKRGRIFVTNLSQAQLFLKMPDHISGGLDPLITWGNVAYTRNQLYFGMSATNNQGSTITSYSGLWAVDLTTNALRVTSIPTTETAGVTAVFSYNNQAVPGFGLWYGWSTGSTFGIDSTLTAEAYPTYTAYIETDLIPIGQFLKKKTFENVEFKLSIPLNTGEGIKIYARPYRSGAYTLLGETATAGAISDYYLVNFDQWQWLQFRVEMKGKTSDLTTASYVRLMQLRVR